MNPTSLRIVLVLLLRSCCFRGTSAWTGSGDCRRVARRNTASNNCDTIPSSTTVPPEDSWNQPRRQLLLQSLVGILTMIPVTSAQSRTPGSTDLSEAVQQVQDGAVALRTLYANFDNYSTIDAEGRAGNTNEARRILGGIAPQAGTVAIEVAKQTPLYRIDTALGVIRKAALDDVSWTAQLDLGAYEELVDRLLYALQKADGNFYSVLFAAKGTTMIRAIFDETKSLVTQSIRDLDDILKLFQEAGAPGV
mmetsp:Transcript_3352/g.6947  ORF Transcript_3352/g.6947 Transcript_3352/m.6947 type:complete len:250 (-) Transcript_3352:1876-2625(-)